MKIFLLSLILFGTSTLNKEHSFRERWRAAYLKNVNQLIKASIQKKDKNSTRILKNLKSLDSQWTDTSFVSYIFEKEVIGPNKEFGNKESLIIERRTSGDRNSYRIRLVDINTEGHIYDYGISNRHCVLISKKDTNTLFFRDMISSTIYINACSHNLYTATGSIQLTMVKNNTITCNLVPTICDDQYLKWDKLTK